MDALPAETFHASKKKKKKITNYCGCIIKKYYV